MRGDDPEMHTRYRRLLAALVLIVGGCALPKRSHLVGPDKSGVVKIDSAEVAAAKDAPEPEIMPATRLAAGRLFQSNRQFAKAIEQYRKAIATDPNCTEAYHMWGVLAGYLGRHGEAETALRRAVQLNPGSSVLRNNLGFELTVQRKWIEAAREFRRAIAIDPKFDRAYINLAIALAAQGRFEDALTQFKWVLPEPDAYYNVGLTYFTNHRQAEARAAFERVLDLDPNFEAARRQLRRLPEPDPVEILAGDDAPAPAAFAPDEALIASLTHADWKGIRNTLGLDDETNGASDGWLGDFDGDGDVDQSDIAEFNSCFFMRSAAMPSKCDPGDFDGDGDVDWLDYLEFQSQFVER